MCLDRRWTMKKNMEKSYIEYTANKAIGHNLHIELVVEFKKRTYVEERNGSFSIRDISVKTIKPDSYENGYFILHEDVYPLFLFDAGFVPVDITNNGLFTRYIYKISFEDYMAHSPAAKVSLVHNIDNFEQITTIDKKALKEFSEKTYSDIKDDKKDYYLFSEKIYMVPSNPKRYIGVDITKPDDLVQVEIKNGMVSFSLDNENIKVPELKHILNNEKPYDIYSERSYNYYMFNIPLDRIKELGFKDKFYHIETERINFIDIITSVKKEKIKI